MKWLRPHAKLVCPLPAICGQECVGVSLYWVPSLENIHPYSYINTFFSPEKHRCDVMLARLDCTVDYLVLISLLQMTYGRVTGEHVKVNLLVEADGPAAQIRSSYTFQLQLILLALLPAPPGGTQAVHPPVHINGPKHRGRHGGES